jgi:hypothetical protein
MPGVPRGVAPGVNIWTPLKGVAPAAGAGRIPHSSICRDAEEIAEMWTERSREDRLRFNMLLSPQISDKF